MTVCSTCISWNEGKAHLSTRLTCRSNRVHVLCKTQASWPCSCNNVGPEVHTSSFLQAVVGTRESFFAHAPQSILTILKVYWSTTTSGSTEFTLFVARTIFDYVQIFWINSIKKCRLLCKSDTTSHLTPPIYAKYFTFHIGFHRLSPSQGYNWH